MTCTEFYYLTDANGFSIRLPLGTQPERWIPAPQPNVVRIPLSTEQRRVDDYGVPAFSITLSALIQESNENQMIQKTQFFRNWARSSRWLQRATRAITSLHEGSDIGLEKETKSTRNGRLAIVVVQNDTRWFSPTGEEVPA